MSRYADVLAALREPACWPVAARRQLNLKVPDEAAQKALRGRSWMSFLRQSSTNGRRRSKEWPMGYHQDLGGLVIRFVEPWCVAAAEIVTGFGSGRSRASARRGTHRFRRGRRTAGEHHVTCIACGCRLRGALLRDTAKSNSGQTLWPYREPSPACWPTAGWRCWSPAKLAQLAHVRNRSRKRSRRFSATRVFCSRFTICASRPVALCGLDIAGGDSMILRIASANRDPLQFSDPDHIDFARRGGAQLSLGFGPHSCVGAALIRMTATVATGIFVEKFGNCRIYGPVFVAGRRWIPLHRPRCVCGTQTNQHMIAGECGVFTRGGPCKPLLSGGTIRLSLSRAPRKPHGIRRAGGVRASFNDSPGLCRIATRALRVSIDSVLR